MSTNKPWKAFERLCAKYWGGKRIVPSDDRTRGDVLHPYMYIECKAYLKQVPKCVTLYKDTAEKAKVEGKRPIVCYKREGTSDFIISVAASDLEAAYLALRERINNERFEVEEDDSEC